MCVIISKEKDVNIDLQTLENIIDTNPDGLGYSYWNSKEKCWYTVKVLEPKIKDLEKAVANMKNTCAVIHARIATSGGVTIANVHPFIGKKYTLFHNGIVSSLNGVLNHYSDTRLLHKLIEQFSTKEACEILKNVTNNSNSKFILIDNKTNKVFRFGKFQDYKGLHCSNLYFTTSYKDFWFKQTDKTVYTNAKKLETTLPKDIVNKLQDRYGITDIEDYQYIIEELDYAGLAPTWENVQSITDYIFGYADYTDSVYDN